MIDAGRGDVDSTAVGAVVGAQVVDLMRGCGDDGVGSSENFVLGQRSDRWNGGLVWPPGSVHDAAECVERVNEACPHGLFDQYAGPPGEPVVAVYDVPRHVVVSHPLDHPLGKLRDVGWQRFDSKLAPLALHRHGLLGSRAGGGSPPVDRRGCAS